MDRLSGLDASFLYFETGAHLMHVCGLLELDPSTVPGGYTFDSFRDALAERISGYPSFRKKLHNPVLNLDHPVWVPDEEFDIEHHVRRITVPAPGGRADVAQVCGDIAGQPLDRARPLWEMWVLEGLAGGAIAVMAKVHHAAADGIAMIGLLSELCSLEPGGPPITGVENVPPVRRPRDAAIVADGALRLVKRPAAFVRLLPSTVQVLPRWIRRSRTGRAMPAPFSAPRTSFNATVTSHRSIAYVRMPLADVKEVKNAFGCTVNDVVLAMCSGALRRYLDGRAELPESSLVAMVPVSVREKSTAEGTNRVSGMFTSLASDVADPVRRLEVIAEQGRVAKEHHRTISASMLQDWAQFAPPTTFALAVRVYTRLQLADRHPVVHNLVISNVPGPPVPIYFMGGLVTGFHPFGPVFHGAGLNITVLSNNGHLDVGLIACRELAPHLWDLADDLPIALAELLTAARAVTV